MRTPVCCRYGYLPLEVQHEFSQHHRSVCFYRRWSGFWTWSVRFLLLFDCGQFCALCDYKRFLWEHPEPHRVLRQSTLDDSHEYPPGKISVGAEVSDRYSRINVLLPAAVLISFHDLWAAGIQPVYIHLSCAVWFCRFWPSGKLWMKLHSRIGSVPW